MTTTTNPNIEIKGLQFEDLLILENALYYYPEYLENEDKRLKKLSITGVGGKPPHTETIKRVVHLSNNHLINNPYKWQKIIS